MQIQGDIISQNEDHTCTEEKGTAVTIKEIRLVSPYYKIFDGNKLTLECTDSLVTALPKKVWI